MFEEFDLPAGSQRILGEPHAPGTVCPLALRLPKQGTQIDKGDRGNDNELDIAIAAVEHLQAQDVLTKKLSSHGTLLFRGLPIHTAADFGMFASAFGFAPHEVIGNVIVRPPYAPNVTTANEAPHLQPQRVGARPERAGLEMPEFVRELGDKGILSRLVYKTDKQYPGGASLRDAFGKDVLDCDDKTTRRAKMEAQMRRYGRGPHTTWEWIDVGPEEEELIITHHLPGIRTQPGTNLPSLFTGLAAYWKTREFQRSREETNSNGLAKERGGTMQQLYGDGSPIADRHLARLAAITDELRVLHQWERGDVLVYDNLVAQHGRQGWEGEQGDRLILASMFDGKELPGAYGDADWAQIVHPTM
ncbi:hypothetical protein SLS64_014276 [Diaporthe eres]